MQHILAKLRKIAKTNLPILLVGECGTETKLLARYIHQESPYRKGPFVAVDCAAMRKELLENELFGYEKGAFTGAYVPRKGRIELAQGGSLFLDDVPKLPLSQQARLASFLEEGVIKRLGANDSISLDARVLAASEGQLRETVREGKFRRALYDSFVVMDVPPLRERKDDIPLLSIHFLKTLSLLKSKKIDEMDELAMRLLTNYDYPGNVKELINIIRSAVIVESTNHIKKNAPRLRS